MKEKAPNDDTVVWQPQPGPQHAAMHCPSFEVFYGGARGGGKTDWAIGTMGYRAQLYGSAMRGLFVRRTLVQLRDAIRRAKEIYLPMGAVYRESDKSFTWPNGATLAMAYLERDEDTEHYQGHSYTDISVEELGNFPDPSPVLKLMACLRSAEGVPTQFRATGNPGGPGQHWIKARYIDPCPSGMRPIRYEMRDPLTGQTVTRDRVYIPARLTDNPILLNRDPNYVANLAMQASPQLVRAWLEGDWNAVVGAFFPEFETRRHVVRPGRLPRHWTRFRSFDWGSARPFSVGWYAVSDGELEAYPRGALIRYREWYGMVPGQINVGLKMTAEDVAKGIIEREDEGESIDYSVADPSIFAADGGPSIAERMYTATGGRVDFVRADNRRVAAGGAIGGWDQVRARLVGENGRPMLYFFDTGTELIRTLPALQHDAKRPEDVDTESEDHACDELRYACMSRPYTRPRPETPQEMTAPLRWDQVVGEHMRRAAERRAGRERI